MVRIRRISGHTQTIKKEKLIIYEFFSLRSELFSSSGRRELILTICVSSHSIVISFSSLSTKGPLWSYHRQIQWGEYFSIHCIGLSLLPGIISSENHEFLSVKTLWSRVYFGALFFIFVMFSSLATIVIRWVQYSFALFK